MNTLINRLQHLSPAAPLGEGHSKVSDARESINIISTSGTSRTSLPTMQTTFRAPANPTPSFRGGLTHPRHLSSSGGSPGKKNSIHCSNVSSTKSCPRRSAIRTANRSAKFSMQRLSLRVSPNWRNKCAYDRLCFLIF